MGNGCVPRNKTSPVMPRTVGRKRRCVDEPEGHLGKRASTVTSAGTSGVGNRRNSLHTDKDSPGQASLSAPTAAGPEVAGRKRARRRSDDSVEATSSADVLSASHRTKVQKTCGSTVELAEICSSANPDASLEVPLTSVDQSPNADVVLPRSFAEYLSSVLERIPPDRPAARNVVLSAIHGSDDALQTCLCKWLAEMGPKGISPRRSSKGHTRAGPREHPRNYGAQQGGTGQRAADYKKAQELYDKNRSSLAELVFSGKSMHDSPDLPTIEDVETLFGGILEAESSADDADIGEVQGSLDTFRPVTIEDVHASIAAWQHAAPGVDGISVEAVKKVKPLELSAVFTAILGRNVHPNSWSTSRTVLVPKGGDGKLATNWRPITIGSAVQRLLHRILHRRLRSAVERCSHQRGFVEIDGTLANVVILDHYIASRMESGKAFNVVSLDLSKAFDSVSHNSIRRAMRRSGIEEGMVAYIMNALQGSTSIIKVGQRFTRPIHIRRGVKQGDPLSPLLFNLVLDELLTSINHRYRGGSLENGMNVALMGFADDLVLLSDKQTDVPLMLDEVDQFVRARGMSVNPEKCMSLATRTLMGDKKPLPVTKAIFKISGRKIPSVRMLTAFKYLGHHFGATGIRKPCYERAVLWLQHVERAPLKPDQKMVLLRNHLIPRLQYGLQNTKVNGALLKTVDRLIKASVKRCLHLPVRTPDSVIHAKVRDGGLGIPQLRKVVPWTLLKRLSGLLDKTEDPIISSVLQSDRFRNIMGRLQRLAGEIPADQKWREAITSGPMTSGSQIAVEDPASREWVTCRPHGWSGRDYVRAIHLRTNTLPCRGHPSNPPDQRRCRHLDCTAQETISHILQACPAVHGERIRRHDEVVKRVAVHCRSKWQVETEPHVRHPDGRLYKPDLVIHKNDGTSVVCDVQVSWEGVDGLGKAWASKRAVYGNPHFIEAANRRWRSRTLVFMPLIIGARGIWPRCNAPTVQALGLTKQLKSNCVHGVLKWGSSIHQTFMKRVWAHHSRNGT